MSDRHLPHVDEAALTVPVRDPDRLREALKGRNLAAVGRDADLSRSYLSVLALGQRTRVSLRVAMRLEQALGAEPGSLFGTHLDAAVPYLRKEQ